MFCKAEKYKIWGAVLGVPAVKRAIFAAWLYEGIKRLEKEYSTARLTTQCQTQERFGVAACGVVQLQQPYFHLIFPTKQP
jgi:hypothetical protein